MGEVLGMQLEQVQQAYAGYVYADSTSGQKALNGVGKTGIPVVEAVLGGAAVVTPYGSPPSPRVHAGGPHRGSSRPPCAAERVPSIKQERKHARQRLWRKTETCPPRPASR